MPADTKAFISHASEDETKALDLKSRLATEGIECWCFEEDLRYSEEIELRVKEAIRDSDWLIVMLTDHAQESDWIRWELGFAKELHDSRRGIERPIILAVHDYDQFPAPCEMQPLRFQSHEPYGPLLTFDRHRCYRFRDTAMIPALARSMKPEITRITEPSDRHQHLFEGVGKLSVELFPNELDRPHIDEMRAWLEDDLNRPDSQEWPELLLAAHMRDVVTGYAALNYSRNHPFAYAAFLGISLEWRARTTMRQLVAAGKEKVLEATPQCRGVVFQVDPFDESCLRDGFRGSDAPEESIERLCRVNLFTHHGALMLCDGAHRPIRIRQPNLRPPLQLETEQEHFIMLLPIGQAQTYSFDDEMIGTYLSTFLTGFGPKGLNIPGYVEYLVDFERRLRASLPAVTRFERMYFTPAMRDAMRQRDRNQPGPR